MDGGDVVTVVSVIVAGVASPWIAGQIASRAQSMRFAHERRLHDLDDLRRELDQLGDVLGEFIRATSALVGATDDETRYERYCAASDLRSLAMERVARLRFRLDEDEDVVKLARKVSDGLAGIVSDHEHLTDAERRERMVDAGEANTEFFRAAHSLIGAKVT